MCVLISCEAGGTKIATPTESDCPESDSPESSRPESDSPKSSRPKSSRPESSRPESSNSARQRTASQRTRPSQSNAHCTIKPAASDNAGQGHPASDSTASDSAALYVARRMAAKLSVPLEFYEYSLEAIDVTRSLRHPKLFSQRTRRFSAAKKQSLIDQYYEPYRHTIRNRLSRMCRQYTYTLHVSVRTFDALDGNGKHRRADVGLLYDPSVRDEADLCADWAEELYFEAEMLRVRRNYPRRGTIDSLTKSMRTHFAGQSYLGVEILLNRSWASRSVGIRDIAIDRLSETLATVMQLEQSEAA